MLACTLSRVAKLLFLFFSSGMAEKATPEKRTKVVWPRGTSCIHAALLSTVKSVVALCVHVCN